MCNTGRFSMNYGLLSMNHGLLSLSYGLLSMNYGLLSMHYGPPSMNYGLLYGIVAKVSYVIIWFNRAALSQKPYPIWLLSPSSILVL